MKNRTSVSEKIKREILTEAGYRCAVPTCRTIITLDIHHIVKVSENGTNESSNLIVLCPNCHALYHRGTMRLESIKVWKAMLISLNEAFDRASIDDLIFLNKVKDKGLFISGDGVLKFSKLIASDLVDFITQHFDPQQSTYRVVLSQKGQLLIDAWMDGNKDELEKYFLR